MKVLKIFGDDQMLSRFACKKLRLELLLVHFTIKGSMIKFRQIRLSCINKNG